MINLILPIAITIIEVLPNPEGQDFNEEYFIIKNTSETQIEQLYLDDKEGESPPYFLEEKIPPSSEITLYSNATGISINNDGDEIRIFDSNFSLITTFEIPEALEGVTYPITTTINTTANLRITEIMPNPEEDEATNEWIEIQNIDDETVNLAGLLLDDSEDGSSPWELPEIILAPLEFTTIYRSESGLALNNSDDAARILTPEGEIIDEVHYEKTTEGLSYQLTKNLGEWQWSEPTAGAENISLYQVATTVSAFASGVLSTQNGDFSTSKLELSPELEGTIFQPDQKITLIYNDWQEIIDFEVESAAEKSPIVTIEHAEEPLYQKLLPYLVTILAVVLLSLYEYRKGLSSPTN